MATVSRGFRSWGRHQTFEWLALVGGITLFGLLFVVQFLHVSHQLEESSSLSILALPHPGSSTEHRTNSDRISLHCQDFLNQARKKDASISKIYAAYLHYQPPFWISQHADDKEVVNKGINRRDKEQTDILEKVLRNSSGGILFYQPRGWGWFELLAASKGTHNVEIYNPRNDTNTLRLCESILLNKWHLHRGASNYISLPSRTGRDIHAPRVEIIHNPDVASQGKLKSRVQRSGLFLLKINADDWKSEMAKLWSILAAGQTTFLWVEFSPPHNDATRISILNDIGRLEIYKRHWPQANDEQWQSESQASACKSASCHFWWKRKSN